MVSRNAFKFDDSVCPNSTEIAFRLKCPALSKQAKPSAGTVGKIPVWPFCWLQFLRYILKIPLHSPLATPPASAQTPFFSGWFWKVISRSFRCASFPPKAFNFSGSRKYLWGKMFGFACPPLLFEWKCFTYQMRRYLETPARTRPFWAVWICAPCCGRQRFHQRTPGVQFLNSSSFPKSEAESLFLHYFYKIMQKFLKWLSFPIWIWGLAGWDIEAESKEKRRKEKVPGVEEIVSVPIFFSPQIHINPY